MQVQGIGRVIFWNGGSLWLGQALAAGERHSHHAIQIAIGLTGQVQFRSGPEVEWSRYAAAVIPPDLPHMFQAPGRRVANLLCEAESALGRSLLARFGTQGIREIGADEVARFVAAFSAAHDGGVPDEDLEELALDTLFALSGTERPPPARDQRVAAAIQLIAARLAQPLSLDGMAREVGLSPGRFRHLFVASTGIPFRAYVLWARVNRALELGFGGTSWTEAAHAAGFADSAHFSRTCRRMYGLVPTSIRLEPASADRRAIA